MLFRAVICFPLNPSVQEGKESLAKVSEEERRVLGHSGWRWNVGFSAKPLNARQSSVPRGCLRSQRDVLCLRIP